MSVLEAGRAAVAVILSGVLLTLPLARDAAAADTSIRFSLESKFDGLAAPFLLPLDNGAYRAEGLDVGIEPAASMLEPITRVASGDFEMGFADINALIKFRDANPGTPVKAVFMVYNRPPYAVIARKSRGIGRPKDLEGKKLGAPAADGAFAQWPIFVHANSIDASKVTIENIGFPVREPMLAAGQVDAITGFSFASFVNLKDKGVPVDDILVMLMADYGVDLYGHAIIVNSKFAAGHPDEVKGFLRAFTKALKATVKRPSSAVASVIKRNEAARQSVELERLTMAIRDNIVTPEVKANGYGGIDSERFGKAIDQIGLTYKWKTAKPKLDDVFDASFLPSEAERKYK